jgi:peptidoglycan hydrolase FlgJ
MDLKIAGSPQTQIAPRQAQSGDEVTRAAREFETVFLSQALNSMLEGVGGDGLFGGGQAEEQWKSFLGNEYARAIAETNTTGIAPAIETMLRAYTAQTGEK